MLCLSETFERFNYVSLQRFSNQFHHRLCVHLKTYRKSGSEGGLQFRNDVDRRKLAAESEKARGKQRGSLVRMLEGLNLDQAQQHDRSLLDRMKLGERFRRVPSASAFDGRRQML